MAHVRLRTPIQFPLSGMLNGSVGVSALGVAYRVLDGVDRVVEESPAAKAGLRPGDQIVKAVLMPPDKEIERQKLGGNQSKVPIDFGPEDHNWPLLTNALQVLLPGTTVELTVSREGGKKQRTVTLTPVETADWFNPEGGFIFEPMTV